MLLFSGRIWPGIWLGAILVNLTVASSPVIALIIGIGNTLEAFVGATTIRRFIGIPRRFENGRDVALFAAAAALSCTVAATIAVASLAIEGSVTWPEFFPNWWTWWQGDLTGIIIVTPLVLNWSLRRAAHWPRQKILEALCFALLLLAVTQIAFSSGNAVGVTSPFSLTFSILPFMIWAALRFSQRVVTTAIAACCAIAVYYTIEDLRHFPQASLNESLLTLLAFISAVVITGLVLSAVTIERSRAMERLARVLDDLREQALTDPLTGLYNRRYMWEFLQREWIRSKRKGIPLAVIMIDLDYFKRVNDTFGHQAGDFVLTAIAGLLRTHIRSSDIVCRQGGEEFALILPEATPANVLRRAEDIQSAIKSLHLEFCGLPLGRITASFGVALFPDNADGPDSVLRAADEALYAAKAAGRDCVVLSTAAPVAPKAAMGVHSG